ncbi:MAG: hypothetical protein R3E95_03015 [Thiolinea sp.]
MLGAMTVGSRLAALGLPVLVGQIAVWQSVGLAFALLALPAIGLIILLNRFGMQGIAARPAVKLQPPDGNVPHKPVAGLLQSFI